MNKQKILEEALRKVFKSTTSTKEEKISVLSLIIESISHGKEIPPELLYTISTALTPSNRDYEIIKLIYTILSHNPENDINLLFLGTILNQAQNSGNMLITQSSLRMLNRIEFTFPVMPPSYSLSFIFCNRFFVRKTAVLSVSLFYQVPSFKDKLLTIMKKGFEDKNKEVFGSALQVYKYACPNHFEFIHNHFHKICDSLHHINWHSQSAAIEILSSFCRLFSSPFTSNDNIIKNKNNNDNNNNIDDNNINNNIKDKNIDDNINNNINNDINNIYNDDNNINNNNINNDINNDNKIDFDILSQQPHFKQTIYNNNLKYSKEKEYIEEIMENGNKRVAEIARELMRRSDSPSVVISSAMFLFYNSPPSFYSCSLPRSLIRIISFSPFLILKNIFIISSSQPEIFKDYFRYFFISDTESEYEKEMKINILSNLLYIDTLPSIYSELLYYIKKEGKIKEKAFKLIAKCGLLFKGYSNDIFYLFLSHFKDELKSDKIIYEILYFFKLFLRSFRFSSDNDNNNDNNNEDNNNEDNNNEDNNNEDNSNDDNSNNNNDESEEIISMNKKLNENEQINKYCEDEYKTVVHSNSKSNDLLYSNADFFSPFSINNNNNNNYYYYYQKEDENNYKEEGYEEIDDFNEEAKEENNCDNINYYFKNENFYENIYEKFIGKRNIKNLSLKKVSEKILKKINVYFDDILLLSPENKSLSIWIIGEFADQLTQFPIDLLRKISQSFVREESSVKLTILRLFAKVSLNVSSFNSLEEEFFNLFYYLLSIARSDRHIDVISHSSLLSSLFFPAHNNNTNNKNNDNNNENGNNNENTNINKDINNDEEMKSLVKSKIKLIYQKNSIMNKQIYEEELYERYKEWDNRGYRGNTLSNIVNKKVKGYKRIARWGDPLTSFSIDPSFPVPQFVDKFCVINPGEEISLDINHSLIQKLKLKFANADVQINRPFDYYRDSSFFDNLLGDDEEVQ